MTITLLSVAALLASINGISLHRRVKRLESALASHASSISTQSGNIATLHSRMSSKGL